jgi:uncharacterized protein YkwD
MRFFRTFLVFVLIFAVLIPGSAFAFRDITHTHKHYPAILFLDELGAIQGYEDGEFKPDRSINRAEFMKIVFDSFHLAVSKDADTDFEDVVREDWFARYVRTGLENGHISPEKYFRPSDPVTHAEALVMIGRIKKWDIIPYLASEDPFEDVETKSWFGVYASYAKHNGVLDSLTTHFYPNQHLTRGFASELIYRTYLNKNTKKILIYDDDEEEEEIDFDPVSFEKHNFNFFDDIVLTHPFPNIFYKDEVFVFSGSVTNDADTAFVFKTELDGVQDSYEFYPGKVDDGKFSIPVKFPESGNFKLGMIAGTKGTSKVINVSVLPQSLVAKSSVTTGASKPIHLQASYGDDTTDFEWQNSNDITRVIIFQSEKKRVYLFRHPMTKYTVDYADFEEFAEGPTYMVVQGANILSTYPLKLETDWVSSDLFFFDAVKHYPVKVNSKKIAYSEIPEYYDETKKIHMVARSNKDVFREAVIIDPDNEIFESELETSAKLEKYYDDFTIPASNLFSLHYTPTKRGTHIISIYENTGDPVINIPIYFESIPLIPTFPDLHVPSLSKDKISVSNSRSKLLELVNTTRNSYGLSAVSSDSDLNEIAQSHSDDMVANEFFAHINSQGQTPEDRRKLAGYEYRVYENLAEAVSLEYAHHGLMTSGSHRENILNSAHKKVGFGVAKNSDGYIYVTELFSSESTSNTSPKSSTSLSPREDVLNYISKERSSKGLSKLEVSYLLNNVAKEWTDIMIENNFTSFTYGADSLDNLIIGSGLYEGLDAYILEGKSLPFLKQAVSTETSALESGEEIGISVGYSSDDGIYRATVLIK